MSYVTTVKIIPSCDDQTNIVVASTSSSAEFSSPVQVTPLFRSLAAGIPSPKFSESVSYLELLVLQTINPFYQKQELQQIIEFAVASSSSCIIFLKALIPSADIVELSACQCLAYQELYQCGLIVMDLFIPAIAAEVRFAFELLLRGCLNHCQDFELVSQ